MTTLRQLLSYAKKLIEERPDALDMPVYAVSGSSGVADELSHMFIRTCTGEEEAGPFEDPGTEYVEIYAGN